MLASLCRYALGDVQALLGRLLGRPMPSDVDSAAVAGLLDLLRPMVGRWPLRSTEEP